MKKGRTVLEAKRYGVVSCQQETPLLVVCQHMMASDVTALVVVNEHGFLQGIISQTDILRAHLEDDGWAEREARDFMSPEVVTVSPDTTLLEVAQLLLTNRIHRVVAVQEEDEGRQRPVAVVSSRDLVYHMMRDA
jgi:CBS domain-containing protein